MDAKYEDCTKNISVYVYMYVCNVCVWVYVCIYVCMCVCVEGGGACVYAPYTVHLLRKYFIIDFM